MKSIYLPLKSTFHKINDLDVHLCSAPCQYKWSRAINDSELQDFSLCVWALVTVVFTPWLCGGEDPSGWRGQHIHTALLWLHWSLGRFGYTVCSLWGGMMIVAVLLCKTQNRRENELSIEWWSLIPGYNACSLSLSVQTGIQGIGTCFIPLHISKDD